MALIKYSLGEIIGSIGANTFQRGRFGAIMRFRTTPVNPATPEQSEVRGALSLASYAWQTLLTPAQRANWDAYAVGTPWTNAFGDPVTLPGRQHFIRLNVFVLKCLGVDEANLVGDAPIVYGLPDNVVPGFTADTTNGLRVTSAPGVIGTTKTLQFQISPPLQPARNFWKGPWSATAYLFGADTLPKTLVPAASLVIGQRYVVRSKTLEALLGLARGFEYAILDVAA